MRAGSSSRERGAALTRYVGDGSYLLQTGPVSDRDQAEVQHRAALTVAEHAQDAEDALELLAMLGLLDEA